MPRGQEKESGFGTVGTRHAEAGQCERSPRESSPGQRETQEPPGGRGTKETRFPGRRCCGRRNIDVRVEVRQPLHAPTEGRTKVRDRFQGRTTILFFYMSKLTGEYGFGLKWAKRSQTPDDACQTIKADIATNEGKNVIL